MDSFYSEVRWEVQDEAQLKSNDDGVSCIGAITHGLLLCPLPCPPLASLPSSLAPVNSPDLFLSCLHSLSDAHWGGRMTQVWCSLHDLESWQRRALDSQSPRGTHACLDRIKLPC